jgi:hypothetical protein
MIGPTSNNYMIPKNTRIQPPEWLGKRPMRIDMAMTMFLWLNAFSHRAET